MLTLQLKKAVNLLDIISGIVPPGPGLGQWLMHSPEWVRPEWVKCHIRDMPEALSNSCNSLNHEISSLKSLPNLLNEKCISLL